MPTFAEELRAIVENAEANSGDVQESQKKACLVRWTSEYEEIIRGELRKRAGQGHRDAYINFQKTHFQNTGLGRPAEMLTVFLTHVSNPDEAEDAWLHIHFEVWNNAKFTVKPCQGRFGRPRFFLGGGARERSGRGLRKKAGCPHRDAARGGAIQEPAIDARSRVRLRACVTCTSMRTLHPVRSTACRVSGAHALFLELWGAHELHLVFVGRGSRCRVRAIGLIGWCFPHPIRCERHALQAPSIGDDLSAALCATSVARGVLVFAIEYGSVLADRKIGQHFHEANMGSSSERRHPPPGCPQFENSRQLPSVTGT